MDHWRCRTLKTCVDGPVSNFTAKWPNFMQQQLDPKLVGKERGAVSRKTPERIYHIMFWGLMQSLRAKGWEVSIEPRAGGGYIDIRLRHRRKRMAVLIELKSSESKETWRGMPIRRSSRSKRRTIEIRKVFRTFPLFENMVSLAFTSVHFSKGDTWSSMVRISG